ncbi:MAG: hypothetical protein ABMA00_06895 [Gemmatimonas sp.]
MTRSGRVGVMALLLMPLFTQGLSAQAKKATASRGGAATDSARADSVARAFLEADERFFERRLADQRVLYLKGASWAELGDRCNPGSLRVFANDTSVAQRDSLQRLVERMEQTIVARGVGARLDTPEARTLLRVVVGWEAGLDRPLWDVDGGASRETIATGLTGDVPDPRGPGCLSSPVNADTVTFVIPGYTTMDFPTAPKPRVKAYFGADAQRHARDEFFAARGRQDPLAELSYILVAPVVIWRGWALVGVDRPREKGGVDIGRNSNGGAVYLMRQTGGRWRLLTIVRTWGSKG